MGEAPSPADQWGEEGVRAGQAGEGGQSRPALSSLGNERTQLPLETGTRAGDEEMPRGMERSWKSLPSL